MKNNETIYSRLAFLVLNSECLNMSSFFFAWYVFQCSYLLLKLAPVTLDSAQIDLKLFTPILAKLGYN